MPERHVRGRRAVAYPPDVATTVLRWWYEHAREFPEMRTDLDAKADYLSELRWHLACDRAAPARRATTPAEASRGRPHA